MTRYIFFLTCCIFSFVANSQTHNPDSLLSLQSPFNRSQLSLPKLTKGDSLLKIRNQSDSFRVLPSGSKDQLNRAEGKLDSLQHSLQAKLDSVAKLPNPDSLATKMKIRITAQSDSLKSKMGAIKKIETSNEVGKITSSIEGIVTQVQGKFNEKLSGFPQNGMTDLPSSSGLPSLSSASLPGGEIGNVNLLNGSLPEIKPATIELPQVDLPSASIPNIDQPAIPSIKKPGDIGNYSEKISEVTDQVKDYQKEIKDFNPGKLNEIKNTDQWEDKLAELDEVGEARKQIDMADQAKRYYDPEVAKEEVLNKAKQEAINHFAGHEEELKAAMEQLSKLKAKMPDTEGVIDLSFIGF